MIDDLTRTILEERDNIENLRNRELNSNKEAYIKQLQQENKQLKGRINKATNKIDAMFNNGDEFTIIDDLIELDKLLKGDKE